MKLCKNKKTGVIFVWNEYLKGDPNIEIIEEKEVKEASDGKGMREEEKGKKVKK